MQNNFETLIEGFIENKIGISEHFLTEPLAAQLKNNLLDLHQKKLFTTAGVGNAEKLMHNADVRSDSIYWLDRIHEDQYENAFLDHIEDFIRYLNQSCYTGITGYEFHYSMYETGTFYKKHIDQFQNNKGRQFSMISYLNTDWKQADGGELMIHDAGRGHMITPTQGKTVFFKSNELEHEVLLTNQRRISITGWLKQD